MAILIQRENPGLQAGRESRQRQNAFTRVPRSHTQPRQHDRPHVGTIGQSRDSCPTLAGIPCGSGAGYRHKTPRYLRIPHGIGVTGAWHSQHSSVCEHKFPTLPPSAVRGSRAIHGAEDVTEPSLRGLQVHLDTKPPTLIAVSSREGQQTESYWSSFPAAATTAIPS